MCLQSLSDKVKDKYGKQRTGYKVFVVNADSGLKCTDQGYSEAKPRGEWLHEATYRITLYKFAWTHYRLGFHVCLTRQGANAWARLVRGNGYTCKVVHVTFKYPTAWGHQEGYPMAVARQIMILHDA